MEAKGDHALCVCAFSAGFGAKWSWCGRKEWMMPRQIVYHDWKAQLDMPSSKRPSFWIVMEKTEMGRSAKRNRVSGELVLPKLRSNHDG